MYNFVVSREDSHVRATTNKKFMNEWEPKSVLFYIKNYYASQYVLLHNIINFSVPHNEN